MIRAIILLLAVGLSVTAAWGESIVVNEGESTQLTVTTTDVAGKAKTAAALRYLISDRRTGALLLQERTIPSGSATTLMIPKEVQSVRPQQSTLDPVGYDTHVLRIVAEWGGGLETPREIEFLVKRSLAPLPTPAP